MPTTHTLPPLLSVARRPGGRRDLINLAVEHVPSRRRFYIAGSIWAPYQRLLLYVDDSERVPADECRLLERPVRRYP